MWMIKGSFVCCVEIGQEVDDQRHRGGDGKG